MKKGRINYLNPLYSYFVDIKFTLLQQKLNILIFFLIVLVSWFIQYFIVRVILIKIMIHYARNQNEFKKEIFKHIDKPIRNVIFITGFLIACGYALNESLFTYEPLFKIYKSFLLFFFLRAIYHVTNYFGHHPDTLKTKFNLKAEDVLFPFIARIIKVFIIVIGFVMIAFEWGYDINGFITGLGIGGLALALGAKDVLSHIFAGMAIAIDKPFNIGDLISTDNNMEGIVEDMNFRSTKIRTLDKALVSVPNSMIANQYIYNWTRRQNRRVRFLLGVSLTTSEIQLKTITKRIRDTICRHPGVDSETIIIAFDSYTQTSFDILIQYVTNTSDINEFMIIKEEINYEIMKILEEEKVQIALPSQKLYLNNTNSTKQEN